jgi:hypothetical protein
MKKYDKEDGEGANNRRGRETERERRERKERSKIRRESKKASGRRQEGGTKTFQNPRPASIGSVVVFDVIKEVH